MNAVAEEHEVEAGHESAKRSFAKPLGAILSLVFIAATFLPIIQNWREAPKDSFPLSYYPMFSAKRGEKYTVHYLVGADAEGNRHVIPYNLAGTGGLNQTRRQINKMVREQKALALCQAVASKVARRIDEPYSKITKVQVVTGSYRFDDYFHGHKSPITERVRASSAVERGEP